MKTKLTIVFGLALLRLAKAVIAHECAIGNIHAGNHSGSDILNPIEEAIDELKNC